VRQRQNRLDLAAADLTKSIDLLPTATAHLALGQIESRRGNTEQAAEHFRIAAGSQSDVGRAAAISLAKIELPNNPGAYIETGLDVDARGGVIVVIANRSGVALRDIQLDVGVLDPTGTSVVDRRSFTVGGPLDPGARAPVETDLGPVKNRGELQRVRVEVRAAQLAEP
jgi:hypothetical protein